MHISDALPVTRARPSHSSKYEIRNERRFEHAGLAATTVGNKLAQQSDNNPHRCFQISCRFFSLWRQRFCKVSGFGFLDIFISIFIHFYTVANLGEGEGVRQQGP